jgi:hypothetical protein
MVRNASLEAQSNTPLLLSRLLLSRESGYHGYQSARENKGVAPKEPLERYYTDRLAREPDEREHEFVTCKARVEKAHTGDSQVAVRIPCNQLSFSTRTVPLQQG